MSVLLALSNSQQPYLRAVFKILNVFRVRIASGCSVLVWEQKQGRKQVYICNGLFTLIFLFLW